jgi:hypothetical protein
MNTIELRMVIAERNPDLPAPRWKVYNAPRPIYRHVLWTGDFISGRFYAAILTTQEDAWKLIELNRQNAAIELEYISEVEAYQRERQYCLTIFQDKLGHEELYAYIDDPERFHTFASAYVRRFNERPKESGQR